MLDPLFGKHLTQLTQFFYSNIAVSRKRKLKETARKGDLAVYSVSFCVENSYLLPLFASLI